MEPRSCAALSPEFELQTAPKNKSSTCNTIFSNQVDVRKLAEAARTGGGRKRQRLDPAALAAANAEGGGAVDSKNKRLKSGGGGGGTPSKAGSGAGGGAGAQKGFAGAAAAAAAAGGQGPSALGPASSSKALPGGAKAKGSGGWDITGWHAKRGEFDYEYDQVSAVCCWLCVLVCVLVCFGVAGTSQGVIQARRLFL